MNNIVTVVTPWAALVVVCLLAMLWSRCLGLYRLFNLSFYLLKLLLVVGFLWLIVVLLSVCGD